MASGDYVDDNLICDINGNSYLLLSKGKRKSCLNTNFLLNEHIDNNLIYKFRDVNNKPILTLLKK
jgi:hypothetical protein